MQTPNPPLTDSPVHKTWDVSDFLHSQLFLATKQAKARRNYQWFVPDRREGNNNPALLQSETSGHSTQRHGSTVTEAFSDVGPEGRNCERSEIRDLNLEIRNKLVLSNVEWIQNSNSQNVKRPLLLDGRSCFENSCFGHSTLFRISGTTPGNSHPEKAPELSCFGF
jgi:hypothetical protein